MDFTDNEYEVLRAHKGGTIHWFCAMCNKKSVELLSLVFGLRDRLRATAKEMNNMKKEINDWYFAMLNGLSIIW